MDLKDFNPIDRTRLKFFLAREITKTEQPGVLPPTPTALLAALAVMERYTERMEPGQFRQLFGWMPSYFSNIIRDLKNKSLADENHRITSDGMQALAHYANEALVSPEPVEAVLRTSKTYLEAIRTAEELIDKELDRKFEAVLGWPALATPRETDSKPSFSWPDVLRAAKKVAVEFFPTFPPDAILTFPGPSQIFAGLVLANLPPKKAVRLPVYTVILVKKETPFPGELFQPAKTILDEKNKHKEFTILVPEALMEPVVGRRKNIIAIDDTIISGNAMRALRRHFNDPERSERACIQFACCVCWIARTETVGEDSPEFFGMLSRDAKFTLPWGEGFCFEDALSGDPDKR